VHRDQTAVAGTRPQRVEHHVVVHLQQLRVGEVELEAGDTPLDAVRHHGLGHGLGEGHVQAHVDGGGLGPALPRRQRA
jgi:hypothetical protein